MPNRKKTQGQARLAPRKRAEKLAKELAWECERLALIERNTIPLILRLPAEVRIRIFAYAIKAPLDIFRGGVSIQDFLAISCVSTLFGDEVRDAFVTHGAFLAVMQLGRVLKPDNLSKYQTIMPAIRHFRFREVEDPSPLSSLSIGTSCGHARRPSPVRDRFEIDLDWYHERPTWKITVKEVEPLLPLLDRFACPMLQSLGKTEMDYARATAQQLEIAVANIAGGKQPGEGLTVQDLVQLVGMMRVESPYEEYKRLHP